MEKEFTFEQKKEFIDFVLEQLEKDEVTNRGLFLCPYIRRYQRVVLKMVTSFDDRAFIICKETFPEMHKGLMRTRKGKRKEFNGASATAVWKGDEYHLRIRFLKSLRKKLQNEK